jgi:SAM-dependent methyltransferase
LPAGFDMTAHVAICKPCRIAFQTPRASPEATLAYMNWRWRSTDSYVDDVQAQRQRAAMQLGLVERYRKPPATLLDFGAGSGAFVAYAREVGWEAEGVERSDAARDKALSRFDVKLFEDLPDRQFDVITLWDVIEHLRNPGEIVKSLLGCLSLGGLIFVETGNWENWQRIANAEKWHVYLLDHQFYFSPSSLEKTMKRAGCADFELLDINRLATPGLDQFKRMPGYTLRCWVARLQARVKWPDHGNITTLIAVARRETGGNTQINSERQSEQRSRSVKSGV